jgi:hypothetical protein
MKHYKHTLFNDAATGFAIGMLLIMTIFIVGLLLTLVL